MLIWAESAKCDLLDIQLYLIEKDAHLGLSLALKIAKKAVLLESQPRMGRPGLLEGTREWLLPGLPYTLVYQISESDVEILRVVHQARNWPNEP